MTRHIASKCPQHILILKHKVDNMDKVVEVDIVVYPIDFPSNSNEDIILEGPNPNLGWLNIVRSITPALLVENYLIRTSIFHTFM